MGSKIVTEINLFDLQPEQWVNLLDGLPQFRVRQIDEGLYRTYAYPWELTSLPKALRESLSAKLHSLEHAVSITSADEGLTEKALFSLPDGRSIESVLMVYEKRATVCVSSQAGCAMGCTFCATGQGGFFRNLSAGEIVEQFFWAARKLRQLGLGTRPTNVVLMGMGEPLANFDEVLAAMRILNTRFGVGARSITVSTVGVVPGIERLSLEPEQFNLAVSLHAPNDELRSTMLPINERYPIPKLMAALTNYQHRTRRRISFEYAMIHEVNDRVEHARELASLCSEIDVHVNLIPLNPTPGYPTVGSSKREIELFRRTLESNGVTVTVRDTRGSEIAAACGQLATEAGGKGLSLERIAVRRRSGASRS